MASLDITKQSNPDFLDKVNQYSAATVSIVSIKTDQSRPKQFKKATEEDCRFNRINQDRSIPT